MTPERFGHYLLLKKLAEDPLGELFRAAQIGNGGLERVVLLRVFNGSALEGRRLASHLEGRESIHGALRNPNIGMGLELGQVQGVPFVSYDYISGKNLGVLLDQIVQRGQAVPAEHALLVVERAALAVAVAFETRVADQRVVHGFLVPHLVMLSNEGETRVLGFEVGVGLRSVLPASPALSTEYGRYLSPEAQGGAALQPNDDVYSLGVLLLELLLGRRVPSPRSGDYRPGYPEQVEAVTAHGPAGIGPLLRQSLAPANERIPEVVTWHRTLGKVLADSGYKPTTFNLAFFMHSLFAEDIERETQELEAESRLDLSAIAEPSAVLTAPAMAVSEPELTAPPVEVTGSHPAWSTVPAPPPEPRTELLPTVPELLPPPAPTPSATVVAKAYSRRRRARLQRLLPVVAVALMLGGAGGYWLWERSRGGSKATAQTADLESAIAPRSTAGSRNDRSPLDGQGAEATAIDPYGAVGADPVPEEAPEEAPGVSEEELLERIDNMVSQRTSAVEAALRRQYDAEIDTLRRQLEEARQQQLEAEARENERESAPPPQRRATETDTAPRPAAGSPTRSDASSAETASASVDRTPPAEPVESTQEAPVAIDQPADAVEQRSTPQPGTSPPSTRPTPAPVEAPERVRLGDLVTAGPDVVRPTLLRELQPRYPDMARRLNRGGVVTLEVLVDEDGRVRDTRIIEEAGSGFDEAAVAAAKRARFTPATKNGVRVRMWTRLKVNFENEGN